MTELIQRQSPSITTQITSRGLERVTSLSEGGGASSASSGEADQLFSNKFVWMSGELEAPFNFLQSVVREFDDAKRVVRMTLAGFERNSPTSYVIAAANDKMVITYITSFFYFFVRLKIITNLIW